MQTVNGALNSRKLQRMLTVVIGTVWVFHGLYSKISDGIPRHRQIVERILGAEVADPATLLIGGLEVLLGIWIFTGWWRKLCALLQTLALVSMNVLEILFARDLLISASGMVALNLTFLSLVWCWALSAGKPIFTR